jgi:hypothetical protein
VVVQVAWKEPLSVRDEHPLIDTPPTSKLTVPVAPVVTVAVSSSEAPKFDDVGALASVVDDEL